MLRDAVVCTEYEVKPRKASRKKYPTHGSRVLLATVARTENYSMQGKNYNCSTLPGVSIRPNQSFRALSSRDVCQRSSEDRGIRCDPCGGRYCDDRCHQESSGKSRSVCPGKVEGAKQRPTCSN